MDKEPHITLKNDIDNILFASPFSTAKEVKKDFLFRFTEFYEYKCKELKGGDFQISKGDFRFKLNGKELDQRIAETVTNKIKEDLELYRRYAIINSISLSREELNNNLYKVLSTQGFKIEENKGNYTFSKNEYKEIVSKAEFDNLVNRFALEREKINNAEKRFISKVDSALLLTKGSTVNEIKEIFLSRMKNDHSYQCNVTEAGNYYFIPDFNSFYENKISYEISRKDIDSKIEKLLDKRNNVVKHSIEPQAKITDQTNQINI